MKIENNQNNFRIIKDIMACYSELTNRCIDLSYFFGDKIYPTCRKCIERNHFTEAYEQLTNAAETLEQTIDRFVVLYKQMDSMLKKIE